MSSLDGISLGRMDSRYRVFNFIRSAGVVSRSEIAKNLGLSRASISSIVSKLIEMGLVSEVGLGHPHWGRPPTLLSLNPEIGYSLGFEIDISRTNGILADLGGNIAAYKSMPFDVKDGPDAGLKLIQGMADFLLSHGGVPRDRLVGVAVGMASPISQPEGVPMTPPIMPGWGGYPFRSRLQETLEMPVCLDNDANLGALGEFTYGKRRGVTDLVYLKVSNGIGAGFILSGRLYRGAWGVAGEIGHVNIDEDGPPCSCGSNGCLEAMAGGMAIAERALQAVRAGHPTILKEMSGDGGITVDDVIGCAAKGDETCRQILARAGSQIGIALGDLVNLLNPRMVILGGHVAMKAGALLRKPMMESLQDRAMKSSLEGLEVIYSSLKEKAVCLGGVALVFQERLRPYFKGTFI